MSEDHGKNLQQVARPDDPRRCQAVTAHGQCNMKAVEGYPYCAMHNSGNAKAAQKAALNNYRLAKYQARVQELESSPGIKSLRDEIAVLRIMVEERMNLCQGPMDLILHSGPISDLISRIEKCVSSCHKIEGAMGMLIDKQAILNFAAQVVNIIGEELASVPNGDAIMATISDRIVNAIGVKKED